jgi:hypothetical protein
MAVLSRCEDGDSSESCMKVGDMVKLRKRVKFHEILHSHPGIILDKIESTDGFPMFEVLFGSGQIGWWQDLEIELVEAKKQIIVERM